MVLLYPSIQETSISMVLFFKPTSLEFQDQNENKKNFGFRLVQQITIESRITYIRQSNTGLINFDNHILTIKRKNKFT